MSEPDETTDVDDYLAHTPYLECRGIGHVFRASHKGWTVETIGGLTRYVKRLRCRPEHGGCDTTRVDIYDTNAEFVSRYYEYPDGYTVNGVRIQRREVQSWEIKQIPAPRRRLKSVKKAS
jgi:hypothetical protein